ncbi:hypothetical protein [Chryseobacterium luteum]|uniref:Uncharacterized protein n=1 Tax=Chryseobacterium luteum TaxID=421531 RepID=A0A085ZWB0_9FLAO|nr:hypothetical protein [Chryseobacterium luteum]KFF08724.1 hypothetical protein IX38_04625 [Chryseobacterium luteum]
MKQIFFTIFFLIFTIIFSQKKDTINKTNIHFTPTKVEYQKVELKNEVLENYIKKLSTKNEAKQSIWDTLIPLLIGAFLTLGTQIYFENKKNKKDNDNQILESKSELEKLTYLLRHNYNELAMHKVHKHYWYAQYQYEENLETPNLNDVNKFYNYHIESGNKAIIIENVIAENFSNFTKEISKIQHLTKQNTEVNNLYVKFMSHTPKKPQDIMSLNRSELYELARKEEDKLKKEYQEYIKILNDIKNIV